MRIARTIIFGMILCVFIVSCNSDGLTDSVNPTPSSTQLVAGNAGTEETATPVSEKTLTSTKDLFDTTSTDCESICVLGIRPGETEMEEVEAIVQEFTQHVTIEESRSVEGGTWLIAYIPLFSTQGLESGDYIEVSFLSISNLVQAIRVSGDFGDGYSLDKLIDQFGKPDEVYALTHDIVISERFMNLFLFYNTPAMIGEYSNWATLAGDNVEACFKQINSLVILSPGQDQNFYAGLTLVSEIETDETTHKSLDIATDMMIDDLVDMVEVNGEACISTPRGIWPSQ